MTAITDEYMRETQEKARTYSVVILKSGPYIHAPGAEKIIREHGRRNFSLRADGVLAVVCPVRDGSDVHGIGVFDASVEETRRIMEDDPAVRAELFTYEVHPCLGFPGDSLPELPKA